LTPKFNHEICTASHVIESDIDGPAQKSFSRQPQRASPIVTTIRDIIGKLLESTDRLFVVRSGTEAAWKRALGADADDWLKEHL
jgi:hypothetical protein